MNTFKHNPTIVMTSLKALIPTLGAAMLLLVATSPTYAYTVYTDRAAWEVAVSARAVGAYVITTDTFSNSIASAQSITLDSGIISTNSVPPTLPNSFDNNSVSIVNPGVFDNAVQAGTGNSASNTITWQLPGLAFAFGADFLRANLDRLTLAGDFDGTGNQTILINNTVGGPDGFLGIVGTGVFGSIVFGNNTTEVDAFSIDNASFARSTGVPEPATALLVFGALACLMASVRARRG